MSNPSHSGILPNHQDVQTRTYTARMRNGREEGSRLLVRDRERVVDGVRAVTTNEAGRMKSTCPLSESGDAEKAACKERGDPKEGTEDSLSECGSLRSICTGYL